MLPAIRSRAAGRTAAPPPWTARPVAGTQYRFTRSSVSVSSQRIICAVRKHAPEKAESRWMRWPTSGLIAPAEARKTISLFSARAIPNPSAPVMAMARSATNCSTSSRTNCSAASNSAGRRNRLKSLVPRGQRPPLPHLLMQRRKCQKRLQRVASRWPQSASRMRSPRTKNAFSGRGRTPLSGHDGTRASASRRQLRLSVWWESLPLHYWLVNLLSASVATQRAPVN